ncbi:MAG: hypothetical protein QUS66_04155, partial [Bacteroidota bacterium]|nr:hypothetical protein [Bacteroidota bacterium]
RNSSAASDVYKRQTLTNVTSTSIPAKMEAMIVHADESSWTVVNYSIADSIMTAQISPDTLKIKRGKTVHIYAAPVSAVKVEDTTLTVPLINIGKADYYALNFWETAGLLAGGGWLLINMIIGAFQ